MVHKIGNIFLVAFVASLVVLVKSSSGNPVQNELLEGLKAELKSLRVKVDLLEARNIENVHHLTMEIVKLKAQIDAKPETAQPLGSFDNDSKISSEVNKKENLAGHSLTRAVAPSSCRELSANGHSSDGLYLVKNQNTKKIETVLCTFGTDVLTEPVGTVDVKTKSAHFYVQKNSDFDTGNAVIPFDSARLNEGDAFDLASGIFTVPVPGIYHFQFSAVKQTTATFLDIFLQVNGSNIGRSISTESATGTWDVVSLGASLRLAAGDKVNLLGFGTLVDNFNHFTHFSGWLVEEDFV